MKIDRRFSNGLLVTNSYTLSKSMDYANENSSISTPIDFSDSWARSNFDRTHNYVSTVIYELPWGQSKKWLNDGVLSQIIGGWQLSNIFVAQSGVPLSITASGTLFNTPGNTAYADLVGRAEDPRWSRTRPAVFRSEGVRAAGQRRRRET